MLQDTSFEKVSRLVSFRYRFKVMAPSIEGNVRMENPECKIADAVFEGDVMREKTFPPLR